MSNILLDPLPEGRLAIEASAGTGKTYSVSALVARSIAEKGLTPAQLLVVTFTRAAAAELRERTRGAILEAADAFHGRSTDHPEWLHMLLDVAPSERATRQRHLDEAVATFDDATITTIHGFCQAALSQLGLRSGAGIDTDLTTSSSDLIDEAVRDTLLPVLAQAPDALDWKDHQSTDTIVTTFTRAVRTRLGNRRATVVPDLAMQQTLSDPKLTLWCELVLAAADTVAERQAARHELSFDDLVLRLREAVCEAHDRASSIATISERYQLVMVDEFQDTDPVQWEIFHTLFGERLVTVGDPKQAIYRFRGADVHAYLAATAAAPTVHLATNFRSDSDLIDATNFLVSGMQMGHQRITATPVLPRPNAASGFLPGSPIEVRWLPINPATAHGNRKTPVNTEKVVGPILADLAGVVIELLKGGTVSPGDIAVLVPKGKHADDVSRVLHAAGIPSVRARTGNVLSTPARAEWDLLLAALERPSDMLRARGAAASVFMPYRLEQLDPHVPESAAVVADVQRQLAEWAELLSSTGFLAWYDHVRSTGRLLERMLTTPQGERLLTDLDHIGELIATEVEPAGASPSTVRRALASLTAEAEGRDASETSDRHMRRIDSDAAAVQISTLHGSKGLEYPVVLIPFSPKRRRSFDPVFNDAAGIRTIDIAADREWDLAGPLSLETRKWYSEAEGHGDSLRLLYVGLTRAEHRTVLWWSPTDEASKSALNQYLFDRAPDGTPLNTAPDATDLTVPEIESPSDPAAVLAELAAASGGTIGIVEMPIPASLPVAIPTWKPSAGAAGTSTELGVANTGGRTLARPSWRRWSFTSVSNTREHEWAEPIEHPVVGGADEPEQGEPNDITVPEPTGAQPTAPSLDMPWAHTLGGTEFGTLVHGLFEHVHTNHPDLPAHLRELVTGTYRRNHAALPDDELVRGMEAVITTPLGGIADGKRLADLAPTDRLPELTFDLPFGSTAVTPTAIGEVLLATLPADDPQRPYAQSLADGRFAVNLEGYLQGSIDAVLRIPDASAGHRYVVVDYKTNRLHARDAANPLAAYHPAHLPQHMAHSDYPLQALLYSVALHRFLAWRLGSEYDPAAHLGGIAYLFVRGMVGPNTPQHGSDVTGVFSWRPPAATILALHRLFAGDDAR